MGSIVNDVVGSITGSGNVSSAANTAAEQQRQAGITSANIAAFRPVGMTTRFGTSNFTRSIDPTTGVPYISAAGYTAAPELANLQNQLFGQFGGSYDQAQQMAGQYAPLTGASQSLFNLGKQYLATSPDQAAQDYMASQRNLLAGGRESQLANVRNQLFQTGRGGLATGGTTTGMQATNPEMAAYYNAIAQQDLNLAAQAQQAGQQRTQYGASLFGTGAGLLGSQVQGQAGAYAPLQTQLGLSGQVEQMSQQPYQLGLQLGQAQQAGQTAGAQGMLSGALQGANTQYQGQLQGAQMNNQFLSSLIGSAAGAYGGGGAGAGMAMLNNAPSSGAYMNQIGAYGSGPLSTGNASAGEWWM
jgi:hypothetical protein